MDTIKSMVRIRISNKDAHYGGGLVDGAYILQIMGDAATELSIKLDGDEGLFLRYDEVEFLVPVYAGEYLEVTGQITEIGNTSRKMELIAKKVIMPRPDLAESAADFLEEPIIVARAKAIGVTKKELQRK
jgi:3-aminobutyryl-CoA ammonia-lyase